MRGQSSFPDGFGLDLVNAVPSGRRICVARASDPQRSPDHPLGSRSFGLGQESGPVDLRRRGPMPIPLPVAATSLQGSPPWSCWSTSAALGVVLAASLYFLEYL